MTLTRALSAAAVVAVVLLPAAPALAHNHLANPSGICNQSGKGVSPGNSGETNLNPAGKPVGNAQAGALTSQCDERLVDARLLP